MRYRRGINLVFGIRYSARRRKRARQRGAEPFLVPPPRHPVLRRDPCDCEPQRVFLSDVFYMLCHRVIILRLSCMPMWNEFVIRLFFLLYNISERKRVFFLVGDEGESS